jgi:urease accessory protein
MILDRILPPAGPGALSGRRIERIRMTSADLARHRQRVTTDQGREVGISLPHGTALADGDLLHLDETLAIVVEQVDEDLLRILPRTPEEFALAGYQVGNLHRAAMISGNAVTVLYDKAIEAVAHRFHLAFERARGKFLPLQSSGHSHG